MFSISLRDGFFIFLSGLFGGLAIKMLITKFGGPALGAPVIQDLAFSLWGVGCLLTITVAYVCTRWNKRSQMSARRGAYTGTITVIWSALIGILIFKIVVWHVWFLLMLKIFLASLLFVPLGAILGAMIYRVGQTH